MIFQALQQPLLTKRNDAFALSKSSNLYSSFLAKIGYSGAVTHNTALTLSAFYNGITIICNDYAKLPKAVFQKTQDGKGRDQLPNHLIKYLIDKKPNQYMTAFQFDTVMLMAAILKGNAYAYIERDKVTGQPIALQYINQEATPVEVKSNNNKLYYLVKQAKETQTYHADDILHIPGFTRDGVVGIGVVKYAAQSLGVSLEAQKFAGDYYSDKGVGTGVLTTTKSMDGDAKTRYSNALSAMFATKSKWVVPIIDEASNFEHLKITPQESQFLLASEQGINEVARWLNISPQKLKNNKDVNNSISESLERQHVSDSILPWAIKFQQEYDAKLLSTQDHKSNIYIKFNTNSLLSADMTAQADYWSKLIFAGVYTRNEVRAMLEKNPIDGLDEPLTPVNTQLMDQIEANLKNTKNVEK